MRLLASGALYIGSLSAGLVAGRRRRNTKWLHRWSHLNTAWNIEKHVYYFSAFFQFILFHCFFSVSDILVLSLSLLLCYIAWKTEFHFLLWVWHGKPFLHFHILPNEFHVWHFVWRNTCDTNDVHPRLTQSPIYVQIWVSLVNAIPFPHAYNTVQHIGHTFWILGDGSKARSGVEWGSLLCWCEWVGGWLAGVKIFEYYFIFSGCLLLKHNIWNIYLRMNIFWHKLSKIVCVFSLWTYFLNSFLYIYIWRCVGECGGWGLIWVILNIVFRSEGHI